MSHRFACCPCCCWSCSPSYGCHPLSRSSAPPFSPAPLRHSPSPPLCSRLSAGPIKTLCSPGSKRPTERWVRASCRSEERRVGKECGCLGGWVECNEIG